MNKKIIINADDCGRTAAVDMAIRHYIDIGVLTSTTVMANMADFDGAVCLYQDYKNEISFGAHLNLTEGSPLTEPDIFLEHGFCVEKDGKILFDGMNFRWKYLSPILKKTIYKELRAQIAKIRDAGILISHIDSHQHIHFAPLITPLFAQVAQEMNVLRIRRPKNFLDWGIHDIALRGLNVYYMFQLRRLKTTDFFSSADAYIKWKKKQDGIYELMCHPGHVKLLYQKEMSHIQDYLKFNQDESLITYNEM